MLVTEVQTKQESVTQLESDLERLQLKLKQLEGDLEGR